MSNIRERTGRGNSIRRQNAFRSAGNVNPLNYISNLSDVMLILALGIMVAVVLHWNVDLKAQQEKDSVPGTVQTEEIDAENILEQEILPDEARPVGKVYYDETSDSYYITYDKDDSEEK